MTVTRVDPSDKRARRRFARLERELLRDEPLFLSEIDSDVDKRIRGRSPFYEEMDAAWFLAGDGAERARCAALRNRRWQRDKGDRAGFIGYFAAAPGAEAEVAEMLGTAERWLAEQGCDRAIAGHNGAVFHGMCVLADAYDEEPFFPMPWQPPHYRALIEGAGYRPTYPFWLFDVDFSSERYRTVSRTALEDARCEVRPLDKKRWDEEIERLRSVFNDTFSTEWEFHAMTSEEFRELYDQFKPVLDPNLNLFAEVDGEIAGFCLGMPDWGPLFRSFRGKMGPLQIVRLLLRARRYDRAGLLSIDVRDQYRGRHIGQTLAATLYRCFEERGIRSSYYYVVNDHNLASRRLAESLGGRGRLLYHAYDKPLARG